MKRIAFEILIIIIGVVLFFFLELVLHTPPNIMHNFIGMLIFAYIHMCHQFYDKFLKSKQIFFKRRHDYSENNIEFNTDRTELKYYNLADNEKYEILIQKLNVFIQMKAPELEVISSLNSLNKSLSIDDVIEDLDNVNKSIVREMEADLIQFKQIAYEKED